MPQTRDTPTTDADDGLISLRAAAKIPNVSPITLRRRVEAGELPAYRIKGGQTLRVRRADVLALLEPIGGDMSDER